MPEVLEIRQPGPYHYTYSAQHAPIARVQPGQRVRIHTVDAFGNKVTCTSDKPSELNWYPQVNPQTGPIYIEGAEPGDTLLVHLHAIEPTRDFAVTALIPGFGALVPSKFTPMLAEPLPEEVRLMPIRDGHVSLGKVALPCRPFLGTIGVAPEIEAIHSLTPAAHGGNMDCVETAPGHTIMFPVSVPGALFFTGDAHATQGDGEITGVAAEIPARVTCTFELRKDYRIQWPRIMSPTHLMATGSTRPLDDALRIATAELIDWMVTDYGLDRLDAYHLLGQAVEYRVGNMVDPNFTVVAKIRRAYLTA